VGPFTVQYYCPSRQQWFQGERPYESFKEALFWAAILKRGSSPGHVIDSEGNTYQV
jgi:hypothetical protein